jgi:membrane protein YdbS with pleckstrin-like domain
VHPDSPLTSEEFVRPAKIKRGIVDALELILPLHTTVMLFIVIFMSLLKFVTKTLMALLAVVVALVIIFTFPA